MATTSYTQEKVQFLMDNAPSMTIQQLFVGLKAQHSHKSIREKLSRLGLRALPKPRNAVKNWTPEEDQFLRDNIDVGISQLAKLMELSYKVVYHRAKQLDLIIVKIQVPDGTCGLNFRTTKGTPYPVKRFRQDASPLKLLTMCKAWS